MSDLFKDAKQAQEMMLRVYNGKMVQEDKEANILGDEKAITALCAKVFGDGSENPNPALLHDFNNIVVRVADKVAKPNLDQLLKYLANSQNVSADTLMVEYKRPHPVGLKFKWSAIGSNPALKRVEQGAVDYLKVDYVQTAISYNKLTQNSNCVENFRALVEDIASAKINLIYETMMNLVQASVKGSTGLIPADQICDKSGVTPTDFNKVANILARRTKSKPLFIADIVLINALATQIAEGATSIMVDSIKSDVYNYELTNLRTATAVPMVNEFTSLTTTTDTQFKPNRGYMVGAGAGSKPFEVAMAGGLVQKTEDEFIHGRVKMTIRQGIAIDLVAGYNLGYVEDDAIVNPF